MSHGCPIMGQCTDRIPNKSRVEIDVGGYGRSRPSRLTPSAMLRAFASPISGEKVGRFPPRVASTLRGQLGESAYSALDCKCKREKAVLLVSIP